MKIDSITINVYNEDDLLNENFEIQLFSDSGDDVYPDGVELSDEIIQKINLIRNNSF